MPSLFVIENRLYQPEGTNRVDYIPQAMKSLERVPAPENYNSAVYCPPMLELSGGLAGIMKVHEALFTWDVAKRILIMSQLGAEVKFDDDEAIDPTFPSLDLDFAKPTVGRRREVVHRTTIRGFRDGCRR